MPLSGVRVLDLSRLAPGPYATRLLAEMGADVLKVEPPNGGDYMRWIPPLTGEPPQGATFHELNAGKRSVVLNLKDPEHVQVCEELAMKADILVDGFRPGVMAKLGLDPAELMQKNPRLIYCAITGFGLTGPDANRPGHDINYVARAGVLATNGNEAMPHTIGVQVADFGGAMVAVAGITAALFQREKTQKGSVVDVSLTESAMAFNAINQGAVHGGHEYQRGHELLDGSRPCYRVYECKEGFLAVGAIEPKFWGPFLQIIGHPELLDCGFDTGKPGLEAIEKIQTKLLTKTRDEWMELFGSVDCCVEPVLELHEVDQDPQHVARGLLSEANTTRSPIRIHEPGQGEAKPKSVSRSPGLGEDQQSTLANWGISPDMISRIDT